MSAEFSRGYVDMSEGNLIKDLPLADQTIVTSRDLHSSHPEKSIKLNPDQQEALNSNAQAFQSMGLTDEAYRSGVEPALKKAKSLNGYTYDPEVTRQNLARMGYLKDYKPGILSSTASKSTIQEGASGAGVSAENNTTIDEKSSPK